MGQGVVGSTLAFVAGWALPVPLFYEQFAVLGERALIGAVIVASVAVVRRSIKSYVSVTIIGKGARRVDAPAFEWYKCLGEVVICAGRLEITYTPTDWRERRQRELLQGKDQNGQEHERGHA